MLEALVLFLVIYLIVDGALGFPICGAAGSGAMKGYKAGRDERRRQIDAELSKSKKGKRILARRQRQRAVRAAVWQAVRTGAESGWDAGADRRAKQWAWAWTTTRSGGVQLVGWLAAAREKLGPPEPDGTDVPSTPNPQQAATGPQPGPQQAASGPQQAPAPNPQQPSVPGRSTPAAAGAPAPATAGSAVAIRPAQPSSRPTNAARPQPASVPLHDRPNQILAATVRNENVREEQGAMAAEQRVTCRQHELYRKDCCAKAAAVV
jgi:hypothetical protein